MKVVRLNIFRFGRVHPHLFPVLVWLAAAGGVAFMFCHRAERFEVVGVAQGRISQVTAPCDGFIKTLNVELFDEVTKGQTLVVFDDELIKAQIATISAEAEHLRAGLAATEGQLSADQADRELNRTDEERRLAVDVENARLEALKVKALIASDEVTLQDLANEVAIAKDLLDKGAVAPYDLEKAQALHDALAKKIEENRRLLETAQGQLQEAQGRREEFAAAVPYRLLPDAALEAIRREMAVQERLINELLVQEKALTVTAPIDGVVIQIQVNANQVSLRRPGEGFLRRAGEFVRAGDPILIIAQAEPTEIIAYAGEKQANQIRRGIKVELIKTDEPPQIASSEVSYVGPVVEQMPARLWQNPNIPQWGRPFLVKVPDGMKLTPGEMVGMRRQ
jgi:multidrug resistance efflux pump